MIYFVAVENNYKSCDLLLIAKSKKPFKKSIRFKFYPQKISWLPKTIQEQFVEYFSNKLGYWLFIEEHLTYKSLFNSLKAAAVKNVPAKCIPAIALNVSTEQLANKTNNYAKSTSFSAAYVRSLMNINNNLT